MSIRIKLVILILVLVTAFSAAATTYFVSRAPVAAIRGEQQTLADLRTALRTEALNANRLLWRPFADELTKLSAADEATKSAFTRVEHLTVLPRLSSSVKDSIGNIRTLRGLIQTNTSEFLKISTHLKHDASAMWGSGSSFTIVNLTANGALAHTSAGAAIVSDINDVLGKLYTMSSRLSMSVQVIDDQTATIAKEVHKIESRSALTSLVVIIILIGMSVAIALLMSDRLVRMIRQMEASIARMREGDLTVQFVARSKDELGSLSQDMNEFTSSLRDSILIVQNASAENMRMKDTLTEATAQTSASATQIQTSVSGIDQRMTSLELNLGSTNHAAAAISEAIGDLSRQIEDQATMVEESTASVTQMIASIDNVAKIAERRREATEELLGTVGGGGDKMRAAFEHVRQISESLESVNGIASIIKSISAQTNLLAMNAAIEAAHAGDAGRGFSVVADEIRKLAEASSSNSQEISHILGGVSSSVEDAAVSAELLNSAFFQIDREVRELSNSLREIFGNMAELRSGSSQILEAMETLRRVSTRVRDKSSAISEQSGSIREVAETGKSTGSDVRAGMADIVVGMKEISTAVDDVLAIARRIGKVGEGLNSEITRFRTS